MEFVDTYLVFPTNSHLHYISSLQLLDLFWTGNRPGDTDLIREPRKEREIAQHQAKSIPSAMFCSTSRHLVPRKAASLAIPRPFLQIHPTSSIKRFVSNKSNLSPPPRSGRRGWSTGQVLGFAAATGILGGILATRQTVVGRTKERSYADPEKFVVPKYATKKDLETVSFRTKSQKLVQVKS